MKKIVWAEGVLLGQQHLQQWENYHDAQYNFLAKLISPFWWGVKKIAWDENSLLYGHFVLKTCDVIFPNGVRVKYDSRINTALGYVFTAEHENSESIYLGVPLSTQVKNITGYPLQSGLSGWIGHYECVLDEYDDTREREVLFAHPNLVLLSSKDDKTAFCVIKIAELRRKNVGEFFSDPSFIPACLCLDASDTLVRFIQHQTEWLSSKISVLPPRYEYLPLLNMFLMELRILKSCLSLHPFELYRWLVRLCGVFSQAELPAYDVAQLGTVFLKLGETTQKLINGAIPAQFTSLEWIRETEFLYTARHISNHHFKQSFYLAVTHDLPVMEWLSRFTAQIKVGPPSRIESIIASALSGVSVIHVQRPPSNLHIKSGYEYFYIEPKGFFWEHIKAEQSLSLFVSRDFSMASIELLIINEDNE